MPDLTRQNPGEPGSRGDHPGGEISPHSTTDVGQAAETVTGRKYTATRPRGFAPWSPRSDSRELLSEVEHQLDAWRAQWPLTARQVFYGIVSRNALDKTESGYKRLLSVLNRGRRAGMIPWHAIRDDGATYRQPFGYDDVASFWESVKIDARTYRRDRLAGQPRRLEVWCEAGGMMPQLFRVTNDYGVPVASSGGFDSVTAKHTAAMRFRSADVPAVVLHIGDYDPSGCAIVDSVAEDIVAFGAEVEFRRLAVTPEQITSMGLPTALPKRKDKRGGEMEATVQAEAIAPAVLADLVRSEIEGILDMDTRAELLEIEAGERDAIVAHVAGVQR